MWTSSLSGYKFSGNPHRTYFIRGIRSMGAVSKQCHFNFKCTVTVSIPWHYPLGFYGHKMQWPGQNFSFVADSFELAVLNVCKVSGKLDGTNITIKKDTDIFKTLKFVCDDEMAKSYFDADLVSATEALVSPLRQRVSLDAQATTVFSVQIGVKSLNLMCLRRWL